MLTFIYDALPSRVLFGVGCVDQLPAEVERLGAQRVLVLCTPGHRALGQQVAAQLGGRAAGVFAKAVMHVPIETARAARQAASQLGAEGCVAVGGGSTIGLGKAIALEHDLPIIAIPTTYAGSEMTPIWGLTQGGQKRTGRDRRVLPRTVIYDPTLTVSLPPALSATSGINALAHCVEALYAPDTNPIIALMAEEGIRALATGLPRVVAAPTDLDARSQALYGAWLAGVSLGSVSMGLHHKLCHTLGGAFGLPHAETHTVILSHVVRYNQAAAPEVLARVARALGVADAATGIFDLAIRLGAKMALRDIGMRSEDLDRAADLATREPYPNPAPITRDAVRDLLDNAYAGRRPIPKGGE